MEKIFLYRKKVTPERFQKIKLLGEKSIRLELKLQGFIQIKIFFHI